jgi:hypothetical protein
MNSPHRHEIRGTRAITLRRQVSSLCSAATTLEELCVDGLFHFARQGGHVSNEVA